MPKVEPLVDLIHLPSDWETYRRETSLPIALNTAQYIWKWSEMG